VSCGNSTYIDGLASALSVSQLSKQPGQQLVSL
jgi:hypothetical protein